jgi:hypothetical protein
MTRETDAERNLTFTIQYALAYSKNWPGGRKPGPISELSRLAEDVRAHLLRSNYRIGQGAPAQDAGSWPKRPSAEG